MENHVVKEKMPPEKSSLASFSKSTVKSLIFCTSYHYSYQHLNI